MPNLQELNGRQIEQAIHGVISDNVPVTVTFSLAGGWVVLHARIVKKDAKGLLLSVSRDTKLELHPEQRIGLSFKLRHYKHIFSSSVLETPTGPVDDSALTSQFLIAGPTRMQRLQRRAYTRADVPSNKIVRASFWLGGPDNEPLSSTPTTPVWAGKVTNISAGGFQLLTDASACDELDTGDNVGVRLLLGMGDQAVFTNAQIRYLESKDDKAVIGFQFIGLDQTPEGRESLSLISSRVSEFQHEAQRQDRQKTA